MGEILNGSPGVFLDRDGTLIRDVGYLSRPDQIEILPRVPDALRLLHEHGFKIVVVTNQSGVARGFFDEHHVEKIHLALKTKLAEHGAVLDGIYYCPHHPTEGAGPYHASCECRKPNAGLAKQAARDLNLDFSRSYVVGDKPTDVGLAVRIGAKGIRIHENDTEKKGQVVGSKEVVPAALVVKDLWEAAQWIVRDARGKR
jgi:D-glycero-D-manno-heptose 1,7-bisphosphate phosphatase